MINWLRSAGLRLLLALGLAFSLWMYVSFRENPNDTSQYEGIQVETENLEAGLVIVDQNGLPVENRSQIVVSVQGPSSVMQTLRPIDMRAVADLSGLAPGQYQVPVNIVTTREGLARISFSADPSLLPFRIETEITRTVPLTIEVVGSVPFSYEQLEARASVNTVLVNRVAIRGPESRLNQVVNVRAVANINQLTANYSSPRQLEAVDTNGTVIDGVTITPTTVDVLVPIVSSVGIKRVPIVPQITGRPAAGSVVSDIRVTPEFVTLTGSSGPLDAVQSISTEPVDLASSSGVISRTVRLLPPAGVTLLENEPESAVVTVTTAAINQPFTVTIPAQVFGTNLSNGLLLGISPNVVQVTLSGSAELINTISDSALQGTVDLDGLDAGTYSLEPTFALPAGISIIDPPSVTVTLRVPPSPVPTIAPTIEASPSTEPADTTPEPEPSNTAVPPPTTAATPGPEATAAP